MASSRGCSTSSPTAGLSAGSRSPGMITPAMRPSSFVVVNTSGTRAPPCCCACGCPTCARGRANPASLPSRPPHPARESFASRSFSPFFTIFFGFDHLSNKRVSLSRYARQSFRATPHTLGGWRHSVVSESGTGLGVTQASRPITRRSGSAIGLLIRQGLRAGSGPQRLIRALGEETGSPIMACLR